MLSSKTISGHKSKTHNTVFDFVNLDNIIEIIEVVTGDVPKVKIIS